MLPEPPLEGEEPPAWRGPVSPRMSPRSTATIGPTPTQGTPRQSLRQSPRCAETCAKPPASSMGARGTDSRGPCRSSAVALAAANSRSNAATPAVAASSLAVPATLAANSSQAAPPASCGPPAAPAAISPLAAPTLQLQLDRDIASGSGAAPASTSLPLAPMANVLQLPSASTRSAFHPMPAPGRFSPTVATQPAPAASDTPAAEGNPALLASLQERTLQLESELAAHKAAMAQLASHGQLSADCSLLADTAPTAPPSSQRSLTSWPQTQPGPPLGKGRVRSLFGASATLPPSNVPPRAFGLGSSGGVPPPPPGLPGGLPTQAAALAVRTVPIGTAAPTAFVGALPARCSTLTLQRAPAQWPPPPPQWPERWGGRDVAAGGPQLTAAGAGGVSQYRRAPTPSSDSARGEPFEAIDDFVPEVPFPHPYAHLSA